MYKFCIFCFLFVISSFSYSQDIQEGIYEVIVDKIRLSYEPAYEPLGDTTYSRDDLLVRGAKLFILKNNRTGKKEVINGKKGEWIKVSLEDDLGYIFDGNLKKTKHKVLYYTEGIATDFSCGSLFEGNNRSDCFLTFKDKNGNNVTGLCNVRICFQWVKKGMPDSFKGKKIKIKYLDNKKLKEIIGIGCTCCCDESTEEYYRLFSKGRKLDVTPPYDGVIIYEVKKL